MRERIVERIARGLGILARIASGLLIAWAAPGAGVGQVLTSQYDNMRTGTTTEERILTPQDVNSSKFGKLGAFKVDGAVYAQPLFVGGVEIPGHGKHDVLFVATEHDSVYAFDAFRPGDAPLWQVSLLDKSRGAIPVPDRQVNCPFIQPEVGVTSTPVIDGKTGTLYVLARTMIPHALGKNEYFQDLHALAITTGAEKFGGPKRITASVPGKGSSGADAKAAAGQVAFNPLRENPRAALVLTHGLVYLTWASSCDEDPYHGWVMAYDAATLEQKGVLNVTPDGSAGGIWASDTGAAVDESGNLYVPTGNGTFNAASGGRDYGDTVLKLALDGSSIAIRDYFTPHDEAQLSKTDKDLGSSGPLLLPDQPGPHKHLVLQPSKGGMLYVIDRDRMGNFQAVADAIVQTLKLGGEAYGAIAYWNGHLYFAGSDDFLRDYVIANGRVRLSATSRIKFKNPGATPSVSANGGENAVVWAIATKTWDGPDQPAVLYAFDAKNIGRPIYTSEDNSKRDQSGTAMRFVFPVVVRGHVYFGARGEVELYGLLK